VEEKEIKWEEVKVGDIIDVWSNTGQFHTRLVVVGLHKDREGVPLMAVTQIPDTWIFVHDGSANDVNKIVKYFCPSEELLEWRDLFLLKEKERRMKESTLRFLKGLAKKYGIKGYSRMRRQQLISC
jgi:hypothetical protein